MPPGTAVLTVLLIVAAALFDVALLRRLRRRNASAALPMRATDQPEAGRAGSTGGADAAGQRIDDRGKLAGSARRLAVRAASAIRQPREWGKTAEVAIIILWGHWLGLPFLDYRETYWPLGREFGFQLQSHHLWEWLRECGLCALWNGGINGGYPAFAEPYGAPLHPVIALTTLGWGTVVGAKLTVVLSFCLAGIAQWSMARAMGLRAPARIWAGMAAVVGGHITGRMDLAGISLVLSTAFASLALAAMLDLGVTPRRRSALLLGVFGALTLVSGQGYMQVALLGWAPCTLFFVLRDPRRFRILMREYSLALILAVTLAGIFLVPFLHFWPNVQKAGDYLFGTAQPLEYIPLNLVIRDIELMKTVTLGRLNLPHLYNLYIGWAPILLVGFALLLRRRTDWRALSFLFAGTSVAFLLASAVPFRGLLPVAPWLATIKHTPLLAGLAVPGILAVAAYGLDAMLRLPLPSFGLPLRPGSAQRKIVLSSAWLLAFPLVMGMQVSFDLAQAWLGTTNATGAYEMASKWQTTSLEWVQPPFGEHFWLESSLGVGLKLSVAWYPWAWEGRQPPLPRIEATQGPAPKEAAFQWATEGVRTYVHEDRHYAHLTAGGVTIPCEASGGAGDIVVRCSADQEGELTVEENSWDGWHAWVDGEPIDLLPGEHLTARSSPGTHEYRFRYLPWDVPVGLAITILACAATIALYVRAAKEARRQTCQTEGSSQWTVAGSSSPT